VVLVSGEGRTPFEATYGYADEARRVRTTPETPFNLASVGKLFTSIAVATLVRDKRLSLADTVSRHVPELPVASRMTVGELLRHTSGLGELGAAFDTVDFRTALEYLPHFRDTSLSFPPGTRTQYSNRGYVVAGAVVERVSRDPFPDYVRKAVTDPLGMKRTGFIDPADASSGRAVGFTYYPSVRGGFAPGPRRPNTSLVRRGSPAGGSYASAEDLLKLAEALRTRALGGTEPIFTMETADTYGLMISGDRLWFGHGGGHPGVSAYVGTSPTLGMSFVVLSNYDAVAHQVAATIMELAAPAGR
jgi:CubicO group peptidase (beta-lactamase class C family)